MSGEIVRFPKEQTPLVQRKDYAWEREQQLVTQRNLREHLRYKGYVRRGTLDRFMQRLGDWGREYFPFIGRGWDGIGPR